MLVLLISDVVIVSFFTCNTSPGVLQLAKLVEMGFSEDTAKVALESCGGDENAALEKLCSG